MLPKRIQTQIIHNDFKKNNHKRKRTLLNKIKVNSKKYLVLFLETSSIHGLNHVVASRRHPCEIFLWMLIVVLSVFGTTYLSQTTWLRYQSSPTVVSTDRDMYAWNTTFPCLTICNEEKVDPAKLDEFLQSRDDEDKEELKAFITALANATYKNFETIPIYKKVVPTQYLDILLTISSGFKASLTIGALGRDLEIIPTLTEMGLCYAINSKVAVYTSPNYVKANRWDIIKDQNESLMVHPLDGEVFANIMNMSSYFVYVHGPLEVPDISTKYHYSADKYYMKLYVSAMTVYTSPQAASLKIGQRRCRFTHENSLKHFAVYSYTYCQMECRARLCLKYCLCLPYFYRTIGEEKLCDVEGLHCLAKHRGMRIALEILGSHPEDIKDVFGHVGTKGCSPTDALYKLRDKEGKKISCGCLPICDDVNYVIQSNDLQEWILGTNLQWGIESYPRLRYRRDIIFGFTDVLVAVGGMAGLFLGCSVLSFVEIIYFMTLRLFYYTRTTLKK